MGFLPFWDVRLAAEEVERMAPRGIKAFSFSENPTVLGLPSVHSDYWESLCPAINASDARTQPGKFTLSGDSLYIGWNSADALGADYQAPFRFTGGRIKCVGVDVTGQPVVDLEKESQGLLARD